MKAVAQRTTARCASCTSSRLQSSALRLRTARNLREDSLFLLEPIKLIASTATGRNSLVGSSKHIATNRLIEMMPAQSRAQLLADCTLTELKFGESLSEPDTPIRFVYFPLNSFVSLITTLDDGHRLEVGMVGAEGMVGVSLVLGVNTSPQQAIVQGAGSALRIRSAVFLNHLDACPQLRIAIQRYVYVLIRQLGLSAACTHYHLLESRLARWLLNTRDRAHSPHFRLTHEFLSYMLGVRRVGVSEAAAKLNDRGIIRYRRGNISILDEAALERRACACYAREKVFYDDTMRRRRNG
jgi:CRP-like cAMP-binding protein